MSKITYDLSEQDPEESVAGANYVLPAVGVYKAKITKCDGEDPADKDARIHVVVDVSPAKEKNKYAPIHEYLNLVSKAAMWRLDQFLQATGYATKSKRKGTLDTTKLVGKTVDVYLTHESDEYPPGTTRTKARVANWIPQGTKLPAGAAPAAEEESTEEGVDLEALGIAADAGDEDAEAQLTDLAEPHGIDPEEIATWVEVAALISEAQGGVPEEEAGEEEPGEEEEDLDAVAALADEDDEDAQARLTDLAEPHGIDPDEIDTWVEVLEAIRAAGGEEGAPDEAAPDYDAMSITQLKALAKERSISPTGTRAELLERHAEYDATDPFEE